MIFSLLGTGAYGKVCLVEASCGVTSKTIKDPMNSVMNETTAVKLN